MSVQDMIKKSVLESGMFRSEEHTSELQSHHRSRMPSSA